MHYYGCGLVIPRCFNLVTPNHDRPTSFTFGGTPKDTFVAALSVPLKPHAYAGDEVTAYPGSIHCRHFAGILVHLADSPHLPILPHGCYPYVTSSFAPAHDARDLKLNTSGNKPLLVHPSTAGTVIPGVVGGPRCILKARVCKQTNRILSRPQPGWS